MEILFLLIGAAAGAAAVGVALKAEVARWRQTAHYERDRAEEKARYAAQVEQRLGETIEAAAARAVKGNNEEFLALAGERLAPIDKRFQTLEQLVRELERSREHAYGSLSEQLKGLLDAQVMLRTETGKLAGALMRPGVRGKWGELTLRRVVELAGMVENCDFAQQVTVDGGDGRIRPDMVVRLPGGGAVVVDAKAPLDAYLKAADVADESARAASLEEHARALRDHMTALSRKAYWEQFERAPDFVVMFVPGEAFVAAAAEQRPGLFEEGFAQKVVLATPSTLIALLRVVAYGWNQERLAENAEQVRTLASELHRRLSVMAGHWTSLGKKLGTTVESYNKAVGSLERKVLPQARRFETLGAGSEREIPEVEGLDAQPVPLTAPEMVEPLRAVEPRVAIDDPDYGTLGRAAEGG